MENLRVCRTHFQRLCKERSRPFPTAQNRRPALISKAIPHNSRLTAQAPLRRLRHGICVAKMLDNVGLRYPHRTSGTKAPRTLRLLPLLRFAVSATGGAHLCSIQYYLRFWLGICRTSLAVSALRIMRYCLKKKLSLGGQIYGIKPAWPEEEFYFYLVVLSGQQASSPTNTFHACGMIE